MNIHLEGGGGRGVLLINLEHQNFFFSTELWCLWNKWTWKYNLQHVTRTSLYRSICHQQRQQSAVSTPWEVLAGPCSTLHFNFSESSWQSWRATFFNPKVSCQFVHISGFHNTSPDFVIWIHEYFKFCISRRAAENWSGRSDTILPFPEPYSQHGFVSCSRNSWQESKQL